MTHSLAIRENFLILKVFHTHEYSRRAHIQKILFNLLICSFIFRFVKQKKNMLKLDWISYFIKANDQSILSFIRAIEVNGAHWRSNKWPNETRSEKRTANGQCFDHHHRQRRWRRHHWNTCLTLFYCMVCDSNKKQCFKAKQQQRWQKKNCRRKSLQRRLNVSEY